MTASELREMLNHGPVTVELDSGESYTLQSPGKTIVADEVFATLVQSWRGLYAKYFRIDSIVAATPDAKSR